MIRKAGLFFVLLLSTSAFAQEGVHYTGNTLVNVDYHHGQLRPVMGVHNIQVMRANREISHGWTYNHAPMLAYWHNRFYVEYLSDETGESIPPGQTLLLTSADGVTWSSPEVIFPPYKIPDGPVKDGIAHNLYAVMHQRMGFYVSKSNHLLALGYYGICLNAKDDPNDGNGIGRVVREILPDGKYGPVYFLRYNKAWNTSNTSFPFYTSSKNKDFIAACNELLATPLMMQQWNEEADRDDPLIPLQKQYKAFCYYHLPDKRVVGLWKNALTALSSDEGRTWSTVARAPGFVNSTAKIWGQKMADGRFATVYNPSEYRWPLALSVSDNGLEYTNLLLVNGEVPPMRYGGNYKSYGPQYVRGIEEGNGTPPDSNLWVTYSMNKEDIWVAKIPVPVKDTCNSHLNGNITDLETWNIYSPLWAPVSITDKGLTLQDKDPYDYAKAEHLIPATKKLLVEFSVVPDDHGQLQIELQDGKGTAGLRLIFDADTTLKAKAGARYKNFMRYKTDSLYRIRITLNTTTRFYTINVNGKDALTSLLFAPLDVVERIVFRTGEPRHFPNADTPADQDYDLPVLPIAKNAVYYIRSLKTAAL
ncbi:BNR repeat-like domain-containing protein [Chitinophaga sp. CF118]|uniref:exo-alpha-sialidase n=1 Tax=Chitinophaga sp. CF118 TaxID=1884367 RepID=UPI0008F13348|nr:exo-alpha-sialidase [Chitinophaga sp. CF118]SFE16900.1 BNR repeat-like domain-containing protein [Chitinophaga sp. CF118]